MGKILRDPMISGFTAGCISSIAMNIVDWISYLFRIHDELLLDWAAVAIFGRLATTNLEIIFAQLGQFFFGGLLGVVYVLVTIKLSPGNHPLKGWIYGVSAWFATYTSSMLFNMPHMNYHETIAVPIIHFLAASVFGLVLNLTLEIIENQVRSQT